MPTDQYNQAEYGETAESYGNPSTSQPHVLRETNGAAVYYYDCMPEDFAGKLKWPWIVAAIAGFLMIFPTLLTWLSVEILGGKTSFDAFGRLRGAVFSDLQPTSFTDQTFITKIGQGEVGEFGLYSFTGWIVLGLALVAVVFALVGFFLKQKWAAYIVAVAGGLALGWTVFQFINISNRIGQLKTNLRQVIDANGTRSDDIVVIGGADFAPWLVIIFALLVLISGIFYAVRG